MPSLSMNNCIHLFIYEYNGWISCTVLVFLLSFLVFLLSPTIYFPFFVWWTSTMNDRPHAGLFCCRPETVGLELCLAGTQPDLNIPGKGSGDKRSIFRQEQA